MSINPIDISYLAVIVYGIYKGMSNNFLLKVMDFLIAIASVIIALRFSHIFARVLEKFRLPEVVQSPLFVFLLMFISVWAFLYFFTRSVEVFLPVKSFKPISQFLGIVLWIGMLSIGFSVMLSLGDSVIPGGMKATSYVYGYLEPAYTLLGCKLQYVGDACWEIIRSVGILLQNFWDKFLGTCR